jgi:hypothetical protein
MFYFDDATGPNEDRPKMNEGVLVMLGITAIAALVFWSIVEMARLARLVLRERIDLARGDRG